MARVSELNSALSRPRLSFGIAPKALGYCWGPGAFAAVMMGTSLGPWWIPVPMVISLIAHLVLKWAYRKDPHIFELYSRYSRLAKSYQPFPREVHNERFQRPVGVGRKIRI